MPAYYNDNEPFVVEWLKNLIAAGHLPAGDVDDRSIADVRPEDLKGYHQCHFFAGIGGWALALRLAGWPDNRPIWTGSCPCQPFSAAGKRAGAADARHLWPDWYRLIAECRPSIVFGEQVASPLGRTWLAAVRADLEGVGYAVGAADLCAAGVGAPHLRQRLWFVADAAEHGTRRPTTPQPGSDQSQDRIPRSHGPTRSLDDATGARCDGTGQGPEGEARDEARLCGPKRGCGNGSVAHPDGGHPSPEGLQRSGDDGQQSQNGGIDRRAALQPWAQLEWLPCRDGKARPTQPGLFPLAHGIPGRVGRLRAYGNAIVAPLAAAFIEAYLDAIA